MFNQEQIMNYFTQICLGLKHCHDRNILHRDIKPQNIFLTTRGVCKVGDFGTSKLLVQQSRADSVVGTPHYLSPEICLGQAYNSKTDVWSLGILLYQMTALQTPWQDAQNLPEIVMKVCQTQYPPLPSNTSREIKNLVAMCLQKDPDQRPTINQILNKSAIRRRVRTLLNADLFRDEFSHTLLHNVNVFDEFKRIQAQQRA